MDEIITYFPALESLRQQITRNDTYRQICFIYRRWFKKTRVEPAPADLEKTFENFSTQRRMTGSQLEGFLIEHQREKPENAKKAAQRACRKKSAKFRRSDLTLNDFLQHLLDKHNHPLFQQEEDIMSKLADCFVFTSHHTDLKVLDGKENQISSDTAAIVSALKRGVRVIELNLNPNSDGTDVEVRHEHERNLHSQASLKKHLETIKQYAFEASKYPVIIVLVEQIDPSLQAKVAARINKTFAGKLCNSDEAFNGPLNVLKEKFIILHRQPEQETMSTNRPKHEEYRKIIVADIQEIDTTSGNLWMTDTNEVRILRATENLLEYDISNSSKDIVRFTQKNLLTVYPSSGEIFSSNYDPFIGWRRGAQMVAFNMKEYDSKFLWIMQGLFRSHVVSGHGSYSAGPGYVKKPDILLNAQQIFDPMEWRPVKKILKMKVYMGTGWHLDYSEKEFDARSPPDFFASFEIVGIPADEAREKTVPIMDEWIPEWNQEFEFPLTVPELAMLMIEVREFDHNRSHEFGGQTCLPVWLLRNGIRSVPLYDQKGKRLLAARLLIEFQLD